MNERILVRGEISTWVHAGRALAALAFFLGIVLGAAVAPWGWAIAAGGLVIWLVLEVQAWQARRVRTWLTLHPDGIEVESTAGHRAIHDSQVSAVALETKKNLNNGEVASITRKFTLWAGDSPDAVFMENKIKVNAEDPLTDLINRLLDRLRGRFEQDLAKGGTVSGDGWHLSRTALTLGRPPQDQQIPLGEVTAVEPSEGHMCVWQRGSDTAVARLPLSARNVYLLPGLVQPYLPEQSADVGGADSASGLGRVLFEKRPHRTTVVGVAAAGAIMFAIGLMILAVKVLPNAAAGQLQTNEAVFIASIIMTALGPILCLVGVSLAYSSFRCHERGVWQSSLLGQKTLRYADVGSFQYSATRHYHNGVYTGTHLALHFKPIAADRGPAIKYSTTTRGDDDDLDGLRDFISRAIAARMAEQFNANQPVPWTANIEFLPEGIRYRPDGFLGRKEAQLLPYSDYGGYDLQQGVFYLFAKGKPKYIASEQASADNFFPGFFLLLLLLHQPAEEEVEQQAPAES